MAERLKMAGEQQEGGLPQTSQGGVAVAEKPSDQPNVLIADEITQSKGPGFWKRIIGTGTKPLVLVPPAHVTEILNPEQPQNTQAPSTPQTSGVTKEEVTINASLSEGERLQKAQNLLQVPLTKIQEQAILESHEEASGEMGKDNKTEAGVFNYKIGQLLRKERKLNKAFSKEQRRILTEAGLVGLVPGPEVPLSPADLIRFAADPKLGPIAQQIRDTADAGGADEIFFNRISVRIERLQDDSTPGTPPVDPTLARELLTMTELLRRNAAARPEERRVELRQVVSVFDGVLANIRDLERQLSLPTRDPVLEAALEAARIQREDMRVEAYNQGLYNDVKENLFQIYYDSRVEITRKQKLSGDETTRGISKLQELKGMQEDPNSWEARTRFWSDPVLEARFGGIVDDFYQESLGMIGAVVANRHAVLPATTENLSQLWDYSWKWDPDENPIRMENFNQVSQRVEKERRKRYWVSNRGDYESWIQLVADDLDEVMESIPDMLNFIRTKFQPNDPNKVFETVEQEKDKIIKALDKFGYERGYEIGSREYRKVRRVKSRLGYEINLAGAEEFAKVLHESWDPYLKFMGTIARSFQDTETQDHFVDAILLDNEGMMMLAIDQFETNDGEYWRYGRNTAETQNNFQIGDGQAWQSRSKEEILNTLVNNELRPMGELLVNHPAFQRFKDQLDQLDQEDTAARRPLVDPNDPVDVNGNPKLKTRWQEYTEKALDWEENHTIGDPRDKTQRVLFQHPRARSLTDLEKGQMYRPMLRIPARPAIPAAGIPARPEETIPQFERRKSEKRERMQTTIDTVLRIGTSFQQDAYAGLARHILTPVQKKELGLPADDEAIPHSRLMKVILERAILEDANKDVRAQRFKLTHVLQEMGIERNLPLFSNWYLGAHDTIRPGLLFNGIPQGSDLRALLGEKAQVRALDPDDSFAGDFKTSMSRMPEEERRFWEIMEVYVRAKYPTYFNIPGHDTAGGGVKEMRNALAFPYGQSWGTVPLSSLVQNMWLGEQAFLPAFGCSSWQQFVGLAKGGNEIVFQRMGGFFESPRDAENHVKRIGAISDESKLLTSGDEKRGGHGILNDGWGSGFHRWRDLNRSAGFSHPEEQHKYRDSNNKLVNSDEYATITDPDASYLGIDEKTNEAYVNLSQQFVAPLVSLFEARLKLENVYARNPDTAKFLNTLTWYSVSNWMDRNWEEYRGKFGNALDVNLHMARKFIRAALYESQYIYYDDQWDQLMLGYTIPTDEWNRIQTTNWGSMTKEEIKKSRPITKKIRYGVNAAGQTLNYTEQQGRIKFGNDNDVTRGYTVKGILDDFPREWRDEIIARNNQTEEEWIIPMGLDTEYPEVNGVIKQLAKYGESQGTRGVYEDLLKPDQILRQTRPRKTIRR